MTGLLVSVRDADEARDAVAAGADLIDVKEPRAGSLGAATPQVIAEVVAAVAGRRPVSVALGELIDNVPCATGSASVDRPQPSPIQFAKLGLAGCMGRRSWMVDWERALNQLPFGVSSVAVAYADWQRAESPPPQEVLKVGHGLGCRALLIDTFDKRGPGLLGLWSLEEIKRITELARAAGMLLVLGGQIVDAHLPQLVPIAPDYIAVRGAVCHGDRGGRLDPERVVSFRRLIEN